jgi:hypothetical protein
MALDFGRFQLVSYKARHQKWICQGGQTRDLIPFQIESGSHRGKNHVVKIRVWSQSCPAARLTLSFVTWTQGQGRWNMVVWWDGLWHGGDSNFWKEMRVRRLPLASDPGTSETSLYSGVLSKAVILLHSMWLLDCKKHSLLNLLLFFFLAGLQFALRSGSCTC